MVRLDMAYKARPIADRFWEKVRITHHKARGCWIWTAAKYPNGYGIFMVQKGTFENAHRTAWRLSFGPIPEGLQVLHRCDNRECVRPTHLFLGTQADNMRDMHGKKRWKYKSRNQSGENNPNSIISDLLVAKMLDEIKEGMGPVSVARKHGISYKTLWAIRQRKAVGD